MIAFASYFDVYSHANIFVGVDPWWNPAHLMLYAGFVVLAYGIFRGRQKGMVGNLSVAGLATVIAAAVFNEIWHRVLLFGNPLPEPFPVEPPHALLAMGFVILGLAALLHSLGKMTPTSGAGERTAIAFTCGSLWLITVGSAFYVGGAYATQAAYLFAVGVGSFSASLFLAYPAALNKKFGYSTISYLWFLLVYYAFFVSPSDGFPYGIGLVIVLDLALSRGRIMGMNSRYLALTAVALLYGVVYYPILPAPITLAINAGLVASVLGVVVEFSLERAFLRSQWMVAGFPVGLASSTGFGGAEDGGQAADDN
jgi:hypothetical protein